MKHSPESIYRFLSYHVRGRGKKRPRMISGLVLCRHMRIRFIDLKALDDYPGLSSMGPVMRKERLINKVPHIARTYAKYNAFAAFFRYTFASPRRQQEDGPVQYACIKDRPFRKGIYQRPRR